jgi:hypothetical protein
VCDLEVMGAPSIISIKRKDAVLESQDNLGLYLDRGNRVEEVEESTVVLRKMNSWSFKKAVIFPMSLYE